MEDITLQLLFVLTGVAAVAGFVDAIAGGGGLISIPVLLWTGMAPLEALATNKLQASFGSFTATLNYHRHGLLDLSRLAPAIALTLVGAVAGTVAVHWLPDSLLAELVPVLLIAFALYFLLSPTPGDEDRHRRIHHRSFALLVGTTVGFYDGFFGPGTGSFFTLAFLMLLGYGLPRAVAGAKLLNFTSNFASLAAFALGGHVLWLVGLTMGVGQAAGAYIGSHMAVRHGARLIRPLLVVTAVALSVKLLLEETGSPTVAG
ncbi:MAG: TSUP family transporter [Pseudomonadota bacterium]